MLLNFGVRESNRPSPIDPKILESYPVERLREMIPRYEKYIDSLSKELLAMKEERTILQDEMQQIEEISRDCSEINVSLNNRLAACEEAASFSSIARAALLRVLQEKFQINLSTLETTAKSTETTLKKLEVQAKSAVRSLWEDSAEQEENEGSHQTRESSAKAIHVELSTCRTVLSNGHRILEEGLREISEAVFNGFSNRAEVIGSNKNLAPMVLVPKSIFEELHSTVAKMKNDCSNAEVRAKASIVRANKSEGEAREYRARLREVTLRKDELEKGLKALGGGWNKSSAELSRMIETINSLHQENNSLAKRLKEVRSAQFELEKQLADLRKENKELVDKSRVSTERDTRQSLTSFSLRGHRQSLGPTRGSLNFLGNNSSIKKAEMTMPSSKLVGTSMAGASIKSISSEESDKPRLLVAERTFAREKAILESQLAQKSKDLEQAKNKLMELEKQNSGNNPFSKAIMEEQREESFIINENLNESIADSTPYQRSRPVFENRQNFSSNDQYLKDGFRKLHSRIKSVYKNFVVMISSGKPPRKDEMTTLEKQLNDTLETIMLYLD